MGISNEFYRILHEDGVATRFQVIDLTLVPLANFEIAYKWYREGVLTGTSARQIEELLEDPAIKQKYKSFLNEQNKVFFLPPRHKKRPAPGPVVS